MDIKTEIKEEPCLERATEEMKFISEQPVSFDIDSTKQYENTVAICENYCEISEKLMVTDACLWNDSAFKKEYHNSTTPDTNNFSKDFKIDLKEDPSLEVVHVSNVRDNIFSQHLAKVQTGIPESREYPEIDTRLSIKKDPLWLEKTSLEVKHSSEVFRPLQNENQDILIHTKGIPTDHLSSESMSYSGSSTADGSDIPTLFSIAKLDKDGNLKMTKHQSDFQKARTYELQESDEIHFASTKEKTPNECERTSICEGKTLHTKAYKCDICEKEFARKTILRTHILTHVDRKPYKCDICDKSFIRKSSLREHNMNHEGKKPYNCNFCGRSFKRMPALNLHLLTHEIKKPPIISCKLCKKSFIHMIDFITHKKVHDGKALQLCELCGKIFPFMSSLKRHYIIAHESRRQHKCEICGTSFKHKNYLKRHTYVVHEIKKPVA